MTARPLELPDAAVRWLVQHSITVLRVAVGIVFLAFAIPKFQPGASPAEALARQTVNALTLHLINGHAAVLLTAEMETFIGFTLITGWALRAGLAVMSVAMIGILSPLVLFVHQLFGHGISLEAQYVFKDIVLVASGLVVAASASGARLELEARAPALEVAPAAGPFATKPAARPAQWTPSAPVAPVALAWGTAPQPATAGVSMSSSAQRGVPRAPQRPVRTAPVQTQSRSVYVQSLQASAARSARPVQARMPQQGPAVQSEVLERRPNPAMPSADEEYVPMYSYDVAPN